MNFTLLKGCEMLGQLLLCGVLWSVGAEDADVVIVGATVYDGTAAKGQIRDVAVRGDRIVAVGSLGELKAKRRIDAKGLILAPGFIDLHSHSDRSIVREGTHRNLNYLWQGATTVVTGNCGSGPIDVGGYYQKIDKRGAGTNILHLLPHGNLRREVMGTERRPPSPKELTKMQRLARKAMTDGAWGMSTGLIYVPSSFSKTEELIALAQVIGKHQGIYATHMRGEGSNLLRSVEEALRIGKEGKLPVHVSHFKASGISSWGTAGAAIRLIDNARREGQSVTADQYPYTASSTSLAAMVIPTRYRTKDAFAKALKHPEQSKQLRQAISKGIERRGNGKRLLVASYSKNRSWQGKTIAELAAQENLDPVDLVIQMQTKGGAAMINFGMSDEDVRLIMRQPFVATASDGSSRNLTDKTQPHPRSFGCFPRKIGRYCLRDKIIPLEKAIRSCSGLPADILGLQKRGYIRADYAADIVVFDPKTFIDTATYQRPLQHATGVRYLLVNGTVTIAEGKFTEKLGGRALRKNR